jgi:hypothetical protein
MTSEDPHFKHRLDSGIAASISTFPRLDGWVVPHPCNRNRTAHGCRVRLPLPSLTLASSNVFWTRFLSLAFCRAGCRPPLWGWALALLIAAAFTALASRLPSVRLNLFRPSSTPEENRIQIFQRSHEPGARSRTISVGCRLPLGSRFLQNFHELCEDLVAGQSRSSGFFAPVHGFQSFPSPCRHLFENAKQLDATKRITSGK